MRALLFYWVVMLGVCFGCPAQDTLGHAMGQHKSTLGQKLRQTVWIAGLSGTVIDDDGKTLKDVFDVKNTWDFFYFPSKLNVEGVIGHGFSIEGAFTYSQLKKGKLISDGNYARPRKVNLLAFDVDAKFYPLEVLNAAKVLDPYTLAGWGYTFRSFDEKKNAITFNFGFGLNVWMIKGFGISAQSVAKFALNKASGKNYLQHSLGIVYRFSLLGTSPESKKPVPRYDLFDNTP